MIVFHPRWQTDEQASEKLERLDRQVQEISVGVKDIVVAGYSAGSALVVASSLVGVSDVGNVYLISGKLRGSRTIGPYYTKKYPALKQVVEISEANSASLRVEDASKILTLQPMVDLLVPVSDMHIEGVATKRLFAFTHPWGIAAGLLYVSQIIDKNQ